MSRKSTLPVLLAIILCPIFLRAQESGNDSAVQPDTTDKKQAEEMDKRAFGVLPNYRTADGSLPFSPISAKYKMTIAVKDSFDGPLYITGAVFASIYHLENQNPSFGQGLKGFAHRYVTAFGDQAIGNLMTEGVMPSLLHQDPRYFRRGTGSTKSRLGYAVSRIFVCKNDKGNWTFNTSELLGNATGAAISNIYYPDTRTAKDNTEKFLIQLGTDALSQVLKEFWPDVKRKWFNKHKKDQQALLTLPNP